MTAFGQLQNLYKAQKAREPWAIAWATVKAENKEGKNSVNPLMTAEVNAARGYTEKEKKLAAKIAAGISENSFNNSMDGEAVAVLPDEEKSIQKVSPSAMGALAGWWLGGTIQDIARGMGQPTAAQQREFERQIQQAMRKKSRKFSKDTAMEKMQTFFQNDVSDTYVRRTPVKNAVLPEDDTLQKDKMSFPPFASLTQLRIGGLSQKTLLRLIRLVVVKSGLGVLVQGCMNVLLVDTGKVVYVEKVREENIKAKQI